MTSERKSIPAFRQLTDSKAMLAEAVQHWFETNEIKQQDYIVGVFISNDTDIERWSYEGQRERTDTGLNMAILYDYSEIDKLPRKEQLAIYRKIGHTPGLEYMEQRALEKFLIGLFGYEHLNIEPQKWHGFRTSNWSHDYEHATYAYDRSEGRLLRFKDGYA